MDARAIWNEDVLVRADAVLPDGQHRGALMPVMTVLNIEAVNKHGKSDDGHVDWVDVEETPNSKLLLLGCSLSYKRPMSLFLVAMTQKIQFTSPCGVLRFVHRNPDHSCSLEASTQHHMLRVFQARSFFPH